MAVGRSLVAIASSFSLLPRLASSPGSPPSSARHLLTPTRIPNPRPPSVHPAQTEQGRPTDRSLPPRRLRGRGLRETARSSRSAGRRHAAIVEGRLVPVPSASFPSAEPLELEAKQSRQDRPRPETRGMDRTRDCRKVSVSLPPALPLFIKPLGSVDKATDPWWRLSLDARILDPCDIMLARTSKTRTTSPPTPDVRLHWIPIFPIIDLPAFPSSNS